MITLDEIIYHCRIKPGFMQGISRENRQDDTHEFFTPTELVQKGLDQFSPDSWTIEKNFLENSCGDGQILSEVLIRKLTTLELRESRKITIDDFEQALTTLYGVDLMKDNIVRCRERLLCGFDGSNKNKPNFSKIVEQRIVCANGIDYKFKFLKKDAVSTRELKKLIASEEEIKMLAKFFEYNLTDVEMSNKG